MLLEAWDFAPTVALGLRRPGRLADEARGAGTEAWVLRTQHGGAVVTGEAELLLVQLGQGLGAKGVGADTGHLGHHMRNEKRIEHRPSVAKEVGAGIHLFLRFLSVARTLDGPLGDAVAREGRGCPPPPGWVLSLNLCFVRLGEGGACKVLQTNRLRAKSSKREAYALHPAARVDVLRADYRVTKPGLIMCKLAMAGYLDRSLLLVEVGQVA